MKLVSLGYISAGHGCRLDLIYVDQHLVGT